MPSSISDTLILLALAYQDKQNSPDDAGQEEEDQGDDGEEVPAKLPSFANIHAERLKKFIGLIEPPLCRQLSGEQIYEVILFMQGLPPTEIMQLVQCADGQLEPRRPQAIEAQKLRERCVALSLAVADRDEQIRQLVDRNKEFALQLTGPSEANTLRTSIHERTLVTTLEEEPQQEASEHSLVDVRSRAALCCQPVVRSL